MAVVFNDTFTEGSDVELSTHSPDTGTGWTKIVSGGASSDLGILATDNALDASSGATQGDGAIYQTDDTISTANYVITAGVNDPDTSDDTGVLAARIQDANNMYALRFNADTFTLYKRDSGTWSTISTDQGQVLPDESGHTVYLSVDGDTISAGVDDVEQVSVTDTTHSSAGKAGIGMGAAIVAGDDVSRQAYPSFEVDTLGPAPLTPSVSDSVSTAENFTPTLVHNVKVNLGTGVKIVEGS